MACAVLVLRSEVHRMQGVNLRGNLAALCAVADRPPVWLWLGGSNETLVHTASPQHFIGEIGIKIKGRK
jgi:hypothetical protein